MPLKKRRLVVGDKRKCKLCGNLFKLETNKMTAQYCNKCKYSSERRKAERVKK